MRDRRRESVRVSVCLLCAGNDRLQNSRVWNSEEPIKCTKLTGYIRDIGATILEPGLQGHVRKVILGVMQEPVCTEATNQKAD